MSPDEDTASFQVENAVSAYPHAAKNEETCNNQPAAAPPPLLQQEKEPRGIQNTMESSGNGGGRSDGGGGSSSRDTMRLDQKKELQLQGEQPQLQPSQQEQLDARTVFTAVPPHPTATGGGAAARETVGGAGIWQNNNNL